MNVLAKIAIKDLSEIGFILEPTCFETKDGKTHDAFNIRADGCFTDCVTADELYSYAKGIKQMLISKLAYETLRSNYLKVLDDFEKSQNK